jgi:hypothetical protein
MIFLVRERRSLTRKTFSLTRERLSLMRETLSLTRELISLTRETLSLTGKMFFLTRDRLFPVRIFAKNPIKRGFSAQNGPNQASADIHPESGGEPPQSRRFAEFGVTGGRASVWTAVASAPLCRWWLGFPNGRAHCGMNGKPARVMG